MSAIIDRDEMNDEVDRQPEDPTGATIGWLIVLIAVALLIAAIVRGV